MEDQTSPSASSAATYQHLPIAQLKSSPLNPRKHFDDQKLAELAESFRAVGVIEPLVVRPVGGHFEIVCGDRRSRAAQLAKLESVPVIVRPLTDDQALELMVVENNQREDVNALEEADGFARLLKTGYDIDRLADRLGRSKKYVYDRVKLLDLVAAAKKLVLDNRLSAGHAILIARLKPDQQTRVLDPESGALFQHESAGHDDAKDRDALAGLKTRSVRELNHWVSDHVRFDVKHFAKAAPLDFGDVGARVDAAAAKPGRGKKVISITFDHFVQPEARDGDERTYGPRSWKFADGQQHTDSYPRRTYVAAKCEHAVLGVVVAGEQYGRAFEVCVARDKCQVHWKTEIAERSKNQKLRETGQAKRADKNEASAEARRKRQEAERQQEERLRELVEQRAIGQAVDSVKDLTPDILRMVLTSVVKGDVDHQAFNKRFGTKVNWNCSVREVKALSGRTLVQALAFAVLSAELAYSDWVPAELLALFGVDVKKVEADVARELAAAVKKVEEPAPAKKPVQTSAQPSRKKTTRKKTKTATTKKR